jgi:hypothetical protein
MQRAGLFALFQHMKLRRVKKARDAPKVMQKGMLDL